MIVVSFHDAGFRYIFIRMDMKNPFVINGLLGMVRAIPLIVPGKSRSRGSFCCALVVVCLLAGMIAKDAESQEPSFFNSVEVRSQDLTRFTKWRAVPLRP